MPLILTGTSGSTTLDSSAGLTFSDSSNQAAAASPYGLKNRIINGDMVISQRNGTTSVNVSGTSYAYQMDRFYMGGLSGVAVPFTIQQVSDAPTGFVNSVKLTTNTTDALGTAATEYEFQQTIEANNVSDFNLGTANAVTVTLSFWVKSSLTGLFGLGIRNAPTFNRSYVATYTISAANTWERKTVTLTMDTTGTWSTSGNGAALNIAWSLGVGTNGRGTAGVWQAGGQVQTSGCVNVVSNAAATWQITGVQLERNTTATPFEWIPYGTELALCQRYYIKITDPGASGVAAGANSARNSFFLPVTMRAAPTVLASGTFNFYNGGATSTGTVAGYYPGISAQIVQVDFTLVSSFTTSQAVTLYTNGGSNFVSASAEL